MLHAGLDFEQGAPHACILDGHGEEVATILSPPDADDLRHLVEDVWASA